MKLHDEYAIYARIGPYGSRVITIRDRNVSRRVDCSELCQLIIIKLPNDVVNSLMGRSEVFSHGQIIRRGCNDVLLHASSDQKTKYEISDIQCPIGGGTLYVLV